jgi:hypothetical protein
MGRLLVSIHTDIITPIIIDPLYLYVAPADYTSVTRTLLFASGLPPPTVEIPIILDSIREEDETFMIILSGETAGVIDPDSATVTILNGNDWSHHGW